MALALAVCAVLAVAAGLLYGIVLLVADSWLDRAAGWPADWSAPRAGLSARTRGGLRADILR